MEQSSEIVLAAPLNMKQMNFKYINCLAGYMKTSLWGSDQKHIVMIRKSDTLSYKAAMTTALWVCKHWVLHKRHFLSCLNIANLQDARLVNLWMTWYWLAHNVVRIWKEIPKGSNKGIYVCKGSHHVEVEWQKTLAAPKHSGFIYTKDHDKAYSKLNTSVEWVIWFGRKKIHIMLKKQFRYERGTQNRAVNALKV